MTRSLGLAILAAASFFVSGCGGGGGGGVIVVPPTPSQIYTLDPENQLAVFLTSAPTTLVRQVPITGIEGGAFMIAIDYDVTRKVLLGLDDNFRSYGINTVTGVATKIYEPFDGFTSGDALQFEVNPVDDTFRVITQLRANGRIGADGVLIANDTDLFYRAGDANEFESPNVTGFAFSNNVSGASTTALYAIDAATDALLLLPTPNTGACDTVGQLGIDLDLFTSLEIRSGAASNTAYMTNNLPLDGGEFRSNLYTVNLTTGAATFVGLLPTGDVVLDMAVSP